MGRALDLATVSLAEEQVQGARRCLELSVAAAKAPSGPSRATDRAASCGCRLEVAQVMWEHARRLAASDTAEGSVAAAMAHIAAPRPSRGRRSDPAAGRRGRRRRGDEARRLFLAPSPPSLLFGGPALYYERLLERMGI